MKIREIIQTLFPTRTWKLAAIIAGGVLCGLGSYTLYASRAWTYLSDDPATCVNCHIMGLIMLHGIIARTAVTPLATTAMCRTRTP